MNLPTRHTQSSLPAALSRPFSNCLTTTHRDTEAPRHSFLSSPRFGSWQFGSWRWELGVGAWELIPCPYASGAPT